jgi:hypothetical protein
VVGGGVQGWMELPQRDGSRDPVVGIGVQGWMELPLS